MGRYQCSVCGYIYLPENGDPAHGIIPGTAFADLPPDWTCPVCGSPKKVFNPLDIDSSSDNRVVELTFRQSITRTPTIKSFRFIPARAIDFIPGQYQRVMFDPQNPKRADVNKFLSFSCPPGEKFVEVTKRLTGSPFSNRLAALTEGDKVIIQAPLGECVFKKEYGKIGFLIGGIGITPVISILGFIHKNQLNTDAVLLYSNRTEEEIAFRDILDGYAHGRSNIKIVHAVSDEKPRDSSIHFELIDQDFIRQHMPDIDQRVVFIFGPQGMVKAMVELGTKLGCRTEDLKTEVFVGY